MTRPLAKSGLLSATHAANLRNASNRSLDLSPTDALIDLKVGCRLRRQIPVWLDLRRVIHLRISTFIPQ